MPPKPKYRLQVLLVIKEKAKRHAEVALAKALRALKDEEEKLKKLEEEKLKIEKRIASERELLYAKIVGGGALVKDPQVRQNFIRKLKEDLEECENKITEQKEVIRQAQIRMQRCRQDYMIAAQDLNIMEKHKELWKKKVEKELSATEDRQMNELGLVIHQMNKMR